MNISTQLQAIAKAKPKKAPEKPTHARLQNLLLGGPSQRTKAIARYKAVMEPRGWMTQRMIENLLGYASTVSTDFLGVLLGLGLVKRRNKGGAKTFSKREGYEWQWIRIEEEKK